MEAPLYEMHDEDEEHEPEEHLPWLKEARREMYEATKGMTAEEEMAYYQERTAQFRAQVAARQEE